MKKSKKEETKQSFPVKLFNMETIQIQNAKRIGEYAIKLTK